MQKGELQTDEIVAHLLERGTTLYTPYLPPQDPSASSSKLPPHPDQDMRMLRLYSPRDLKGCPTDKWGILDPGVTRFDTTGHAVREDGGHDYDYWQLIYPVMDQGSPKLDLILLPGVAFDSDFNRVSPCTQCLKGETNQ
jgi:5-formyltetrahydrofolate cyclo-ligase